MLLFVVPRFANIYFLVVRKTARPAFVVPSDEHDKASINNLVYLMIPILSSFDNFVLIKVTIESVDGLLWTVIPTSVDPFTALRVLPCTVDLSHDGFGEIIRILDVYPIACSASMVCKNARLHENAYPLSTVHHCAECHSAVVFGRLP